MFFFLGSGLHLHVSFSCTGGAQRRVSRVILDPANPLEYEPLAEKMMIMMGVYEYDDKNRDDPTLMYILESRDKFAKFTIADCGMIELLRCIVDNLCYAIICICNDLRLICK